MGRLSTLLLLGCVATGCNGPRGRERVGPPPSRVDSTYTCRLHPEILQSRPGDCPICGQVLEHRWR